MEARQRGLGRKDGEQIKGLGIKSGSKGELVGKGIQLGKKLRVIGRSDGDRGTGTGRVGAIEKG